MAVSTLPRPRGRTPTSAIMRRARPAASGTFPFFAATSRMLQRLLVAEIAHKIGQRHVKTLMNRLEIRGA